LSTPELERDSGHYKKGMEAQQFSFRDELILNQVQDDGYRSERPAQLGVTGTDQSDRRAVPGRQLQTGVSTIFPQLFA